METPSQITDPATELSNRVSAAISASGTALLRSIGRSSPNLPAVDAVIRALDQALYGCKFYARPLPATSFGGWPCDPVVEIVAIAEDGATSVHLPTGLEFPAAAEAEIAYVLSKLNPLKIYFAFDVKPGGLIAEG